MAGAARARAGSRRREREAAITEASAALTELLAADRRLRGRDQQRRDALSYAQARALIVLSGQDEVTAGSLAKAAELNPGSVTAMLDQLVNAGIVARRRCDHDRRAVLVSLTDRGREVLEAKRSQWRERWDGALADVDDEDIATAARVMRALAAMMGGL